MQGFFIFIEKRVPILELQIAMKKLFPNLNFYEWNIQENIIDGELDKELTDKDILIELTYRLGLFKTIAEFYRFPGNESGSRIDLYIGLKLAKYFSCKTTIDGYSYCDFDQMPDYSLLLENDKAYLIGDCYPSKDWSADDPRINELKIEIIQEIDLLSHTEIYDENGRGILKM
jgi:hypothetical protein